MRVEQAQTLHMLIYKLLTVIHCNFQVHDRFLIFFSNFFDLGYNFKEWKSKCELKQMQNLGCDDTFDVWETCTYDGSFKWNQWHYSVPDSLCSTSKIILLHSYLLGFSSFVNTTTYQWDQGQYKSLFTGKFFIIQLMIIL